MIDHPLFVGSALLVLTVASTAVGFAFRRLIDRQDRTLEQVEHAIPLRLQQGDHRMGALEETCRRIDRTLSAHIASEERRSEDVETKVDRLTGRVDAIVDAIREGRPVGRAEK